MTNLEIGKKLVELCHQRKHQEAMDTLYGKDVVSVEAAPLPHLPAESRGFDAVNAKLRWWADNHTIHSLAIDGPYPHGGDRFAVRFLYDVTNKPSNTRFEMDEIAVFTVDGDKIVREEFFYVTG